MGALAFNSRCRSVGYEDEKIGVVVGMLDHTASNESDENEKSDFCPCTCTLRPAYSVQHPYIVEQLLVIEQIEKKRTCRQISGISV